MLGVEIEHSHALVFQQDLEVIGGHYMSRDVDGSHFDLLIAERFVSDLAASDNSGSGQESTCMADIPAVPDLPGKLGVAGPVCGPQQEVAMTVKYLILAAMIAGLRICEQCEASL
jgi:hypothetical protein